MPWTVVKVGGSLYDLPDLRNRLRGFLTPLRKTNVLIVPGGGAKADAIRALDRMHNLGEESSHWLALHALSHNLPFMIALLPEAKLVADVASAFSSEGLHVLDAFPFFSEDEKRPHHLPHCWEVTSDSLAVRAAKLLNADELILLKSVAWDGCDWKDASHAGIVDGYFADAVRQASVGLRIRVVNLRAPV